MCNAHALNDSLDGLFGDIGLDLNTPAAERAANIARKGDFVPLPNTHVEKCTACRNGRFISWGGRDLGTCRKCKGTGKLVFKLSAQARENARKYAAKRATVKATSAANDAAEWMSANPAEASWLSANSATFEFASSLSSALTKYGRLTEGQINAVRKCIVGQQARDAARSAAKTAAVSAAPACDVSKIEATFATARANLVKRPKMRLGDFIFSMAPAHGVNAGSIYVVDRESKDYLGKVTGGRFIRNTYNCTEEQAASIAAVASDPHAAAKAYGQRFGQCSICGRELTVGESIDRMMGPICAEKYGF